MSKKRLFILTAVFTGFAMFYFGCVYYTDLSNIAIARNLLNGKLSIDSTHSWHVSAPWKRASIIDTRPKRVCVLSAGRSFSCKLVQFNPVGWQEFVAIEGYKYWWWSNRISFNSGYSDEYRGMKDLLRGYAFTGKKYSFVKILKELPDQQ